MKSGFVVLIGRSNVGKSTLLNCLIGTKLSITSPKPQTSRYLIQGVLHHSQGQAVFVDTPGIFQGGHYKLTKKLTKIAKCALANIDEILYVVDPSKLIGAEENTIYNLLLTIDCPKILVINKSDLNKKPYLADYQNWQDNFKSVIEVSALKENNIDLLIDTVFKYLPIGPAYYPDGQLTDLPIKSWLAELIREKIFLILRQEVPYATTVKIEEITERKNKTIYIKAMIITSQPNHKQILIGRHGQQLNQIGQSARRELELIYNRSVYLDLEVKVDTHWVERF
ncbi:MAG: GTPase Era [Candidatus Aenigmarchaeota archaeon]|nr:GTPase Era [Candidatus Aenigmarchaeota archaeon]